MLIWVIVDGVKSDIVEKVKFPVFKWLEQHGASTTTCRLHYPSITEPCMAEMFHSMEATFLGCYWDDIRKYGTYEDFPKGVVSIFKAIKPLKSSVVGTWVHMGETTDFKYVNQDQTRKSKILDENVVDDALKSIAERKVDLLLVYFEDPDHVGHESGVGKKYLQSLMTVNRHLAKLIKAMDPKRDTLVVNSDHGRIKHNHGQFSDSNMRVPLYWFGKNIKRNHTIKGFVQNIDVAPTLLSLAGIDRPPVWRGKVMDEIFSS